MHDVSAKLLQQFVDNLEADVLGEPIGGAAGVGTAAAAGAAASAGTGGGGGTAAGGGTGATRENEPVRVVGMVIKSMFGRLGHAIARLFRRSPAS
jgi:hypothetical protein